MADGARSGFAPALLSGLAELGPVEPGSGDLSLELGLSLWLRRSSSSLLEARDTLLEVRRLIVEVCGLDLDTEPIPLVGRSPRSDVVNLALYVAELLRRASVATGSGVHAVVARVTAALPGPLDEALGA